MATVTISPQAVMGLMGKLPPWVTLIASLIAALGSTGQLGKPQTLPVPTVPPSTGINPVVPPAGKVADPLNAIGKIQFGNAGCSATVIGPKRHDGRWNVLTAAHCVKGTPTQGRMQLRDGKTFGVSVVAKDATSDTCWLTTDNPIDDLPFALISDKLPLPGEKVWHAGFGVDKPGNIESGEVVVSQTSDGQTQFYLSVSSGDSGGGIALDSGGRIVSSVCCTESKGRKANCWGCSVESIRKFQPKEQTVDFEWTPIEIPIKQE